MGLRWPALLGLALSSMVCAVGFVIGLHHREQTARCPDGLVAIGPRCCGVGQELTEGRCSGKPSLCAEGQRVTDRGCVAGARRVQILGGNLSLPPNDWEALGKTTSRALQVGTFWLDSHEVTQARYHGCEQRPAACPLHIREPGLPQTDLSPAQAEQFCARRQGRLPSVDEWMYAASSRGTSRYPWGPTGLVCRRAAFGLISGPCAAGIQTPELAGTRPAGMSQEGLFDLSGNVAEWVASDGRYVAVGGSYRSAVAGELKFWAQRQSPGPGPDIGFRCAYPNPGEDTVPRQIETH